MKLRKLWTVSILLMNGFLAGCNGSGDEGTDNSGGVTVDAMFAMPASDFSNYVVQQIPSHPDWDGLLAEEQEYMVLLNQFRKENPDWDGKGTRELTALTVSPILLELARWQSQDQANSNNMSHTDSTGRGTLARMDDFGYTNTSRAENVAAGNASGVSTFKQWMNSPHHRASMLGKTFKATGISRAYKKGTKFGYYWTGTFGGVIK